MTTIIIDGGKKSDMELLITLAKKMGLNARILKGQEAEDWQSVQKIEAGMKTPEAGKAEVLKALGK